MKTLAFVILCYLTFTFIAGYQRGSDIQAHLFGPTVLGQRIAEANAPDWERVSPAFLFGIDAGLQAK